MVFTPRERLIAGIAISALVLLAVYYFVVGPFVDHRSSVQAARSAAADKLEQARKLIADRRQQERTWAALQSDGLKSTPSEAESQILHSMRDWSQEAGINLSSLKPERTANLQSDKFQEISFHANASGSMAAIARLLWRLETTTVPVRVNSLQIVPRKEASDDLALQLSISTLCLNPEADKSKPRTTATKEIATP